MIYITIYIGEEIFDTRMFQKTKKGQDEALKYLIRVRDGHTGLDYSRLDRCLTLQSADRLRNKIVNANLRLKTIPLLRIIISDENDI